MNSPGFLPVKVFGCGIQPPGGVYATQKSQLFFDIIMAFVAVIYSVATETFICFAAG